MTSKPSKRIAVVDFGDDPGIGQHFIDVFLHRFVGDRYTFELTEAPHADYVFHSCLGYDVLKCPGVRIFLTGECVTPNFTVSDYAMAFDRLTFGDRYCRLPLLKRVHAYSSLCSPRPPAAEILAQKQGFCATVVSNMDYSAPERIELFELLCTYKPVASGGRWRNNVGGPVKDKMAFQSRYKFAIASENTSYPGYVTEKIVDAAQSNTVPIYWGDPTIEEVINPKAFINCHRFSSIKDVVACVRQLDKDDAAYMAMLSEPWFRSGVEPPELRDEVFANFLSNIFDQPLEDAYRRNRGRWGIKMERAMHDMAFRPYLHVARLLRNAIRKTKARSKRR